MGAAERARALPWLALSAAALSWGSSRLPAAEQAGFALTHAALGRGELWRLWTGHLVHFSDAHLRGDLLAFVVWAALLERDSRPALWRILLVAPPLLSLAILLGCARLGEYRGLSGLDCALVVALIYRRGVATERWRGVGWLCVAGFAAKCGYELWAGRAILAPDLGADVKLLPLAHVLGAGLGLAVVALPEPPRARCFLSLRAQIAGDPVEHRSRRRSDDIAVGDDHAL